MRKRTILTVLLLSVASALWLWPAPAPSGGGTPKLAVDRAETDAHPRPRLTKCRAASPVHS